MKLRQSIKYKIGAGFAILIFLFVVNAVVSIYVLNNNRRLTNEISTIVDPSIEAINELNLLINKSKMFSTNWVFMKANEADKEALKKLLRKEFPELQKQIMELSLNWDSSQSREIKVILNDFEKLIASEEEIMSLLTKFEDYEDGSILFMAQDVVESQVLPQSAALFTKLNRLVDLKKKEKLSYEVDLVESSDSLKLSVVGLGLFVIILGGLIAIVMANNITQPIVQIKEVMNELGLGVIPKTDFIESKDEIGEVQKSIKNVIKGLGETVYFANKIGNKELDAQYSPLSEKDVLGHALLGMRDNLKRSYLLETQQSWILDNSAEVSDILRKHNEIQPLCEEVTVFMQKTIGAVQTAFYLVTERDERSYKNSYLDLKFSFAYNRKKSLKSRFRFAEGFVGQCAIEQATILRTEIPDDYVTITSGILGDQRPSCLLFIPLIIDEVVYGVIEFASLSLFDAYKIEFCENVAPSIARTISNIQVNEHTRYLLEQSQIMSQDLREKQEELLQNAEEMKVTQEELERSNQMLEAQIEQVNLAQQRTEQLLYNASEVITIYEKDGTMRYISPSVKRILGYSPEELIGSKGRTHTHEEDIEKSRIMFTNLLKGQGESDVIQYRFQKKDGTWIWLEAAGKNLMDDASVKGIVVNARDITVKIKAEQEERMRKNMQALSENSPDIITRVKVDGHIVYINPSIVAYTGGSPQQYIGQSLHDIKDQSEIMQSWGNAIGSVLETQEKVIVEATFKVDQVIRYMQINAIPEFAGDLLESVLLVSHDVTEQKESELEIREKNKKINESINYSKRIQNAVIPDNRIISEIFPESFIFYHPRDVVSGDFPWIMRKGDDVYVAAVDCTGHGVPGAMLSLVGNFLLNDIIANNKGLSPAKALDEFDKQVNNTLNTEKNDSQIKDGMDIALCRINLKTKVVEYAGAHRPLYFINKGNLEEYKGDKWAIGGGVYRNQTNFTHHQVQYQKGDSLYIFSDGLPDQFGGPLNRKFGPQRIKDLVLANHQDMKLSYSTLVSEFEKWKEGQKQMDDVLLIGIKF
ncbi:MAG: PAS domain S-box protein [Cytophagaceae bacterium]|jgi:PAS domain S-box-containing protein|nr:PAS domain S-box protein [Cytophagaceae bacterium]